MVDIKILTIRALHFCWLLFRMADRLCHRAFNVRDFAELQSCVQPCELVQIFTLLIVDI